MRNCFTQKRTQPTNGSQPGQGQQGNGGGFGGHHGGFGGQGGFGGHHQGGFMMPGFKECTDSLNCNMSHNGTRQAFEACKSNDQNERDQHKQIEQTFCVCLRGALSKTDTDMPCQPPTGGGDHRGGFRRGGRWGGGGSGSGGN